MRGCRLMMAAPDPRGFTTRNGYAHVRPVCLEVLSINHFCLPSHEIFDGQYPEYHLAVPAPQGDSSQKVISDSKKASAVSLDGFNIATIEIHIAYSWRQPVSELGYIYISLLLLLNFPG